MKNRFAIIALCAMALFTNCSKAVINDDPVIGIWTNVQTKIIAENTKSQTEFEWIFNDAYLGRHHRFENNNLVLQTDFQWKRENELYTISYPGTDLPQIKVTLVDATLKQTDGVIFAIRE